MRRLLLCVFALGLLGSRASAQSEWTIGPFGEDFRQIQAALDSPQVTTGDLLRLRPQVDYPAFTVNRGIRIVGERRENRVGVSRPTGVIIIEDIPAHEVVLLADMEALSFRYPVILRRCRGPILLTGLSSGPLTIEDCDLVMIQGGVSISSSLPDQMPVRVTRSRVCFLDHGAGSASTTEPRVAEFIDSTVILHGGAWMNGPTPLTPNRPIGPAARLRNSRMRHWVQTPFGRCLSGSICDDPWLDVDAASVVESYRGGPFAFGEGDEERFVYAQLEPSTVVFAFSLPGVPLCDPGQKDIYLDAVTATPFFSRTVDPGADLTLVSPLRLSRNRLGIPFIVQGGFSTPDGGPLQYTVPYLVVF